MLITIGGSGEAQEPIFLARMIMGNRGVGDRASGRRVATERAALRPTGSPVFTLLVHRKGTQKNPTPIASKCQLPTAPLGRRPPHHRFDQVSVTFQRLSRNEGTGELLKDMCARGNACINSKIQLIFTDRLLMNHRRQTP